MTTSERDRTVDAARAFAVVGVVLGHWLVTAVVAGEVGLATVSPLLHHEWMIGFTWILQTLALFFLAAGYAGATSHARAGRHAGRHARWLRHRLGGLVAGAGMLAAFWLPLLIVLVATGMPMHSVSTVVRLLVSPLWFLLVYAGLMALLPVLRAVDRRFGLPALVVPVAVVGLDDLLRSGIWAVPDAVTTVAGTAAVLAGWMIPFQLGVALARGGLRGRGVGLGLLLAGLAVTVTLVLAAGYSPSLVGIPGERSNLNPLSLVGVGFGVLQVGGFLLLRPWLARVLRRPRVWRPVAAANRFAMGVYFWHQTALLLVTLLSAFTLAAPGLVDSPADPAWLLHRLLWLPAFALGLVALCAAIGNVRAQRPNSRRAANLEDAGDRPTSPAAVAPRPARPRPAQGVRRDRRGTAGTDAPPVVAHHGRRRPARAVQRDALQPGRR